MDLSVGIMPYIFIKNNLRDVDKVNLGCLNTACGAYKKLTNNKFCAHCGHEVGTFNTAEKVRNASYNIFLENDLQEDIMYEIEVPKLKNGEAIIIGNHKSPFENWIDTYDSGVKELDKENPLKVKEQLDWFNEYYAKPIEALKKAYGEENVEIKFGIISYWS